MNEEEKETKLVEVKNEGKKKTKLRKTLMSMNMLRKERKKTTV